MKITRITVKNEEWALEIGTNIVPISMIKSICLPALIFVIAALAYNVGGLANTQTLKYFENITTPQCYSGSCIVCNLVQQGNQIVPVCNTTSAR
jgi:hypothetical protein